MTNETRDISALRQQIEGLHIEVSQNAEGGYTVCSCKEPLFCYDVDSIEKARTLVEDTVLSYAKHFYHIDLPSFSTENWPIDEGPVAVERVTPVARLKPVFDLAA